MINVAEKTIRVQIMNGVRRAILSFPCRERQMEDAMKRICENGECPQQPLVEIIFPKELSMLENRYVNLDELNYLAKRMDSFSSDELMKFYSAVEYEQYEDMENLINLTFNLHGYTLIRDVSSMEAVGKAMLDDLRGGIWENEFSSEDYISFAKDLLSLDTVTLTKYGILYKNENEVERLYDGTVFPNYAYAEDWQLNLAMEYHGRTEYLFLPDEEAAIDKALARLGAGYSEDCKVSVEKSNVPDADWNECLERVRKQEGLFELNELMQAVDPGRIDMKKLTAVIQYAGADCSAQIINLAAHLDEFEYLPDAEDAFDVGREMFEREVGSFLSETMKKHFNFEAFGEEMIKTQKGSFSEIGGYVYLAGNKTLDEILCPEEEIKLGGVFC